MSNQPYKALAEELLRIIKDDLARFFDQAKESQ